jgi:sphinganine-1-phosphate aldolase
METRVIVQEAVEAIPELAVVGRPSGSLIAWRSVDPTVNIFVVADALEQAELVFRDGARHALHGWSIEKQHLPDCVHMTCMPKHRALAGRLVEDMRHAVRYAREHPELAKQGSAAMYGMVAQVPTATLVDRFLVEFESQVYDANPAFFADAQCDVDKQ